MTRYAAPPHAVTGAYPAPGRRAAARRRAVFLARSPDLIWSGTRLILESLSGVVVAGEAPAGAESVAALASLRPPPDLVITAPRAPGLPVEQLLPALRRACPAASLLVLAQDVGADDLAALTAGGIDRYAGYLLWDDVSAATLRQCIGAVCGADILTVSRAVVERFLEGPPPVPLSDRERAVLAQLAAGRSGVQAARALGVSERTFKRVVARLHDTLGAPTAFALGARAQALGLLPDLHDPPAGGHRRTRP